MALLGANPKLASEQLGLGLFGLRLGLGTQGTLSCGNCSMKPLPPRKPVGIPLSLLRAGKRCLVSGSSYCVESNWESHTDLLCESFSKLSLITTYHLPPNRRGNSLDSGVKCKC